MSFVYNPKRFKFHYFYWVIMLFFGRVIGLIGAFIYRIVQTFDDFTITYFDYGLNLNSLIVGESVFILILWMLSVAVFVGFFKRTKYAWYGVLILESGIILLYIYTVYLSMFIKLLTPQILGGAIGVFIPASLVIIYYYRRKPFFFPELMAQEPQSAPQIIPVSENTHFEEDNTPVNTDNSIFCRKCGKKIPSDSEFCSGCGEKIIRVD